MALGAAVAKPWGVTAGGAAAVGVAALLFANVSLAQGVDCARLQAQIASVRGDPAKAQRFLAAAQRQAQELNRTAAYARSIGCENHQFLFFGSPPPAQCAQINPQIQRMQASVQHLQQQAAAAGGEGQRRSLTAQYDSACRGGAEASLQRPRSFFDQLFGGGGRTTEIPVNPDEGFGPAHPGEQTARGGSKAVCVRTCDGGFFPVSYAASRGKFGELEEQCKALCPNAETQLFTYPSSGVIDQAVSADGKPYSSLPNAGLFRTRFNAACTCRPPNESWAQALSGAEKLLGERRTDIIVTPEKSEEMARPTPPSTKKGVAQSAKAKAKGAAAAAASSAPSPTVDEATAADLANSAQAPTLGAESADIGSGAAAKGKAFSEQDGQVVEEAGPDGVKRRVRIIGPKP